jgi:hypothetical protein
VFFAFALELFFAVRMQAESTPISGRKRVL